MARQKNRIDERSQAGRSIFAEKKQTTITMKTIKQWMTALVAAVGGLMVCSAAAGQDNPSLECQTFVYAVKGADTLRLDVYRDKKALAKEAKPILLYTHGGGWESGSRDSDNPKLYSGFVEKGFVVVSIDYRLGYLEARKEGQIPDESITPHLLNKTLDESARIAAIKRGMREGVEDLYDATSYVVKHARQWNANPKQIILAGSSAGACISLQAEYLRCKEDVLSRTHLPGKFSYAGVVSGSGALWDFDGNGVDFVRKPCPIMLFHGEKDQMVPYSTERFSLTGTTAYGSQSVADILDRMGTICWFVSCADADHVIAGYPFTACQEEILSFVKRTVTGKEKVSVRSRENMYADGRTLMNYLKGEKGLSDEDIRALLDQIGVKSL